MSMDIVMVTSADRHYAMPLAVMLHSAVRNFRADVQLVIHVLDGGLTGGQRKKILQSVGTGRCRVEWHAMRGHAGRLEAFPVFGHVSQATYYRLLIPEILAVPKVVYVDADTVVLGDLAELWAEPMGENLLLGVQQGTVTSPVEIAGVADYGISPDHPRLSAGVLVMNLDKWRAEDPLLALKEYFLKYHDRIRFWDQDALNVVLARKWGQVGLGWNYLVDCSHVVTEAPADIIARLRREARIVHYASATKPWDYYANHPGKALFFEYLDRTAWAGWRPSPPFRAFRNPHVWGLWLRRLPLLGRLWARARKSTG